MSHKGGPRGRLEEGERGHHPARDGARARVRGLPSTPRDERRHASGRAGHGRGSRSALRAFHDAAQRGFATTARTPAAPAGAPAHTTLVVQDQQSFVLGGGDQSRAAGSQTMFVVTPCVVRRAADLARLLACKRREREASERP